MIPQDAIDTVKRANGAETTLGTPPADGDSGEAPYGYTLIGAINQLERIAGHMDEYNLAFTDLSQDKQSDFETAHEALQWHVAELSNILASDFVGQDGAIELPNGNSIDLPRGALEGSASANIPERL